MGGGLVLGVGIHGAIRYLAGIDAQGLGGSNFFAQPSLSVGIAIAGVTYGVVTGLALRRTQGERPLG
jgi:hypothetical protein